MLYNLLFDSKLDDGAAEVERVNRVSPMINQDCRQWADFSVQRVTVGHTTITKLQFFICLGSCLSRMLNKVFGKEDKEKKFKKRVTTFQTDKNPSKRWKSLIKIIGNYLRPKF